MVESCVTEILVSMEFTKVPSRLYAKLAMSESELPEGPFSSIGGGDSECGLGGADGALRMEEETELGDKES